MDIDTAFYIAIDAHNGQKDKQGKPYIWHVIRVAQKLETEKEQIVALLHDVFEDCERYNLDTLEFSTDDDIKNALYLLTKGKDEVYEDYIGNISDNKLATKVKLSDLYDNYNRLEQLMEIDYDTYLRLEIRYNWAINYLEKTIK